MSPPAGVAEDGTCPLHPVIQLRRRQRCTGEWKTMLNPCPLCASDPLCAIRRSYYHSGLSENLPAPSQSKHRTITMPAAPPPLPERLSSRLRSIIDPLTGKCKHHPAVQLYELVENNTRWVVRRKICYKCGSRSEGDGIGYRPGVAVANPGRERERSASRPPPPPSSDRGDTSDDAARYWGSDAANIPLGAVGNPSPYGVRKRLDGARDSSRGRGERDSSRGRRRQDRQRREEQRREEQRTEEQREEDRRRRQVENSIGNYQEDSEVEGSVQEDGEVDYEGSVCSGALRASHRSSRSSRQDRQRREEQRQEDGRRGQVYNSFGNYQEDSEVEGSVQEDSEVDSKGSVYSRASRASHRSSMECALDEDGSSATDRLLRLVEELESHMEQKHQERSVGGNGRGNEGSRQRANEWYHPLSRSRGREVEAEDRSVSSNYRTPSRSRSLEPEADDRSNDGSQYCPPSRSRGRGGGGGGSVVNPPPPPRSSSQSRTGPREDPREPSVERGPPELVRILKNKNKQTPGREPPVDPPPSGMGIINNSDITTRLSPPPRGGRHTQVGSRHRDSTQQQQQHRPPSRPRGREAEPEERSVGGKGRGNEGSRQRANERYRPPSRSRGREVEAEERSVSSNYRPPSRSRGFEAEADERSNDGSQYCPPSRSRGRGGGGGGSVVNPPPPPRSSSRLRRMFSSTPPVPPSPHQHNMSPRQRSGPGFPPQGNGAHSPQQRPPPPPQHQQYGHLWSPPKPNQQQRGGLPRSPHDSGDHRKKSYISHTESEISSESEMTSDPPSREGKGSECSWRKPSTYDDKGRCAKHPFIRLRKKKMLGGWKVMLVNCPECCYEEMMRMRIAQLDIQHSRDPDGSDVKSTGSSASEITYGPRTSVGGGSQGSHPGHESTGTGLHRVTPRPTTDAYGDKGWYTGDVASASGLPHGRGTMHYCDGRVRQGWWSNGYATASQEVGLPKAKLSNDDGRPPAMSDPRGTGGGGGRNAPANSQNDENSPSLTRIENEEMDDSRPMIMSDEGSYSDGSFHSAEECEGVDDLKTPQDKVGMLSKFVAKCRGRERHLIDKLSARYNKDKGHQNAGIDIGGGSGEREAAASSSTGGEARSEINAGEASNTSNLANKPSMSGMEKMHDGGEDGEAGSLVPNDPSPANVAAIETTKKLEGGSGSNNDEAPRPQVHATTSQKVGLPKAKSSNDDSRPPAMSDPRGTGGGGGRNAPASSQNDENSPSLTRIENEETDDSRPMIMSDEGSYSDGSFHSAEECEGVDDLKTPQDKIHDQITPREEPTNQNDTMEDHDIDARGQLVNQAKITQNENKVTYFVPPTKGTNVLPNSELHLTEPENPSGVTLDTFLRKDDMPINGYSTKESSVKQCAGDASNDFAKDRKSLNSLVENMDSDPIQLSPEYVKAIKTDKILGGGYYGKVHLGVDEEIGKSFAIKLINPDIIAHSRPARLESIQKSFQNEIKVLTQLKHPNMAQLYGYCIEENDLRNKCLIYEFATNGSLDKFWRENLGRERLSEANVRVRIALEVATVLRYMHEGLDGGSACFHRDIKSSNICLMADFSVRVIDCGLSKYVQELPGSFSSAGATGTPGYICPQYSLREISFESACDVFSFGVLLCEIITGRISGTGETDSRRSHHCSIYKQTRKRKLEDDADEFVDWGLYLGVLVELALECLEYEASSRPSIGSVVEVLQSSLNGNGLVEKSLLNDDMANNDLTCSDALKRCRICGEVSEKSLQCFGSERHHHCHNCVERHLMRNVNAFKYGLACLKEGCDSRPFLDGEMADMVSQSFWSSYLMQRNMHSLISSFEKRVINEVDTRFQKSQDFQVKLCAGNGLPCPRLFILVEADRHGKLWCNPREWAKNAGSVKLYLYFVCSHSLETVSDSCCIKVRYTREWLKAIAPALNASLDLIKLSLLLGVGSNCPLDVAKIKQMEEWAKGLLGPTEDDMFGSNDATNTGALQTLIGHSLSRVAEKAASSNVNWQSELVPVVDHEKNDATFVMEKYASDYRVK